MGIYNHHDRFGVGMKGSYSFRGNGSVHKRLAQRYQKFMSNLWGNKQRQKEPDIKF